MHQPYNAYGFSPTASVIGNGIREARKVTANQVAIYRGVKYRFPDALPCETVFFENGRPCSATAVVIPQDRFGFDVLPENSAASPALSRTRHHITRSPHKTSRSGNWNIRRSLGLVAAKIAQALLQAPQTDHMLHIDADGADRWNANPFQDMALPLASGDDNADKHK